MVRNLLTSLLILSAFLPVFGAGKKAQGVSQPKAYMEAVLSPEKTSAGISTVYSVVVYSNVPDILRVEIISEPSFGSLKANELRLGRGSDTYLGEHKDKGETWYGFVVDSFVVTPSEAGSFKIRGGEYNICLGIEGYADDWFWGRQRTTIPKWIEAKVPDLKLSVRNRPSALKNDEPFSAGEFESSWTVPPGDIEEGSRAIAVYNVTGKGVLDEKAIPDFASAFGEDMEVTYVKPESRTWMKGTAFYSEMEVVVEFIPKKSGETPLPRVAFSYIDPETGKTKSCVPDKKIIDIKSDSTPASSKATIYEI